MSLREKNRFLEIIDEQNKREKEELDRIKKKSKH